MNIPISILHEDLLWRIFKENVCLPDLSPPSPLRPLVIARVCSQVCRQWRYIFLSSSSIWGKMIDMSSLSQKRDDWREEVVSRTGQAPLWVYGYMERRMASFLVPFLQDNWHRVQTIILGQTFLRLSLEDRQLMWDCLRKPAPSLRRIHLELNDVTIGPSPDPLFGDHAPALHSFHIVSSLCKFKPTGSWSHHLLEVTFFKAFSTKEILEALQYMPQLIYLNIDMEKISHPVETYAIHLPRLQLFLLEADLLCAAILLSSITPSRNCCLSIWFTAKRGPPFEKAEYEQYERASMKFIIPYFSLNPPTIVHVSFTLSGKCFNLEDASPINRRRFHIPIASQFIQTSAILKVLTKIDGLSDVEELKLGLRGDYNALRNPTLVSALNIFFSITTLTTIDHVLEYFLGHDSFKNECLPNLTVLKISLSYFNFEREDPAHHRFLKRRRAIGLPISVLEIDFMPLYDVHYLEVHSGLVVRGFYSDEWLGEYRCGDGHPEELRFATRHRLGLL